MKFDLTKYLSRAWITGLTGIFAAITGALQDGIVTTAEIWTVVIAVLGVVGLIVGRDIVGMIIKAKEGTNANS